MTTRTTTSDLPTPAGDGHRRPLGRLGELSFWAENAAPVGFVGIVILFGFLSPTFLTLGNIRSMLIAAAILIILSIAQAFVITTGGIDLSISATLTFGAVGFGVAYSRGLGFWPAVIGAFLAAGVIGLINGFLIAKGKVTDFIATLGTLSVATGLALISTDGRPVTVTSPELLAVTTGSVGIIGYPVILAAVVGIVAGLVMFKTRFGLHVQAVGGNAEAALANGINVDRVRMGVYFIAATLAALAAILLVARVGAAEPVVNTTYLLNSIAAVVLGGVSLTGGRGKIVGPILGALLLTALANGLTLLGVSPFYHPLAVGLVVVAAALITRYQRK